MVLFFIDFRLRRILGIAVVDFLSFQNLEGSTLRFEYWSFNVVSYVGLEFIEICDVTTRT